MRIGVYASMVSTQGSTEIPIYFASEREMNFLEPKQGNEYG